MTVLDKGLVKGDICLGIACSSFPGHSSLVCRFSPVGLSTLMHANAPLTWSMAVCSEVFGLMPSALNDVCKVSFDALASTSMRLLSIQ